MQEVQEVEQLWKARGWKQLARLTESGHGFDRLKTLHLRLYAQVENAEYSTAFREAIRDANIVVRAEVICVEAVNELVAGFVEELKKVVRCVRTNRSHVGRQ
jgi:hypothetical protein